MSATTENKAKAITPASPPSGLTDEAPLNIKPGECTDDVETNKEELVWVCVSVNDLGKLALMVCPNPPPDSGGGGRPITLY